MKCLKSIIPFIQLLILLLGLSSFSIWAHEDTHHQDNIEKGPKGGRLFTAGDIALELMVFEQGMPPHFRAYLYKNGKMIEPDKAHLTMQLMRFNNKTDKITFIAVENFLQSNQIIREPHSFDVIIQLDLQGKRFNWNYSSYEGRVKMVKAIQKAADIQISTVQSHVIKTQLKVVGKIVSNRDTLIPIYARYSGIIKSMVKNLGDEVTKGEVLVTIESNESLQNYTITTPMAGTIVHKYATNGELAQSTKPIYEVANLSNVWADFTLYRKEAPLVKQGMKVIVSGDEGTPKSISTISYISPLGIEDSQTTLARSVLSNENRVWLPGMYVNAAITIKEKLAPMAIPLSAIQHLNGNEIVFVQQGNYFEATPVVLGEKDEHWVEIVSGLDLGQRYVSKNSFIMKAELGKDGASHDD